MASYVDLIRYIVKNKPLHVPHLSTWFPISLFFLGRKILDQGTREYSPNI